MGSQGDVVSPPLRFLACVYTSVDVDAHCLPLISPKLFPPQKPAKGDVFVAS